MNVRLRSIRKLDAAGLGRPELDDAIAGPDFFAAGESGDDVASEIGERKGVCQKAESAATPHAGQGETSRERRRRFVLPQDAQRKQPARRRAGGLDFDFTEQNFVWFITDISDIHDPRVLDRLILEAEPSPFGDVLRQSLVFDELDGRSRQRLRQAVANDHCREFR